jgi:hypothetical protein
LAAEMPMRDFVLLQHYAAKRLLPSHRLAVQMAQVAMLIAQTMGGAKNVKLSDFLLQAPDDSDDGPEDEAAEFFDFKPIMTRS